MHSLCNVRSVYLVVILVCISTTFKIVHFGALYFVNAFVPCVLRWLLLSNELFLFDTNILKQSIPQSSVADGIST